MKNAQPNGAQREMSRRLGAVLVAMLLIVILPVTIVSLPFSTIVFTVSNLDDVRPIEVIVHVYQPNFHDIDFELPPGAEKTVSIHVRSGTFDFLVRYMHPGDPYGAEFVWDSITLQLFESEEIHFEAAPYH